MVACCAGLGSELDGQKLNSAMRKDQQDRNPVWILLKILGCVPVLLTLTFKGYLSLHWTIVFMAALVVGLVFGMKKMLFGAVLPICGVLLFATRFAGGDSRQFAEIITSVVVIALMLLGLWFMLGGPLRRNRN